MITEIFEKFSQERVLVLGDIMLDRYFFGSMDRISPEAPVPVVDLKREEIRIGGAGNVALNIRALGTECRLIGVIGKDERGQELSKELDESGLDSSDLIVSDTRKTTVKSRIIASGQHILRIDSEDRQTLSDLELKELWQRYDAVLKSYKPTIVLVQDYDKGMLSIKTLQTLISKNNEMQLFTSVDPKKNDFKAYANYDLIKPNRKEFCDALGIAQSSSLEQICQRALMAKKEYGFGEMAITLSEMGILLVSKQNQEQIIPTSSSEIVDVCGAGDAVFAVISMLAKQNIDSKTIGKITNAAGSIVCSKVGVVPVTKNEIQELLRNNK